MCFELLKVRSCGMLYLCCIWSTSVGGGADVYSRALLSCVKQAT